MFLFNSFSIFRSMDEVNEKNNIIRGYPLTTSPVIPDILKHQVEFKKLKYNTCFDKVGFTLAHEGLDLVKDDSLELIRDALTLFVPILPEYPEDFKDKLPRNVIAVSVSINNFELGESCQEYKIASSVKSSGNGHFTYRKLSECYQCTYYNENGVEYLAGTTFYPAPHGRPTLLKSNQALIFLSSCSLIQYPPVDRKKRMELLQQYGRFCKTAGRQVLVDFAFGKPQHFDYNHDYHRLEKVDCMECYEEYYDYKWEEPERDSSDASPAYSVPEPRPTLVVTVDETAPAPVIATRSSSTESLVEGFDNIDSEIVLTGVLVKTYFVY